MTIINQLSKYKRTSIKALVFLSILCIMLGSIGYAVLRFNSYNIFIIKIPKKIPQGFKRISIVKKIPPEKDWYFIVTYENPKNQQIVFNYEPQRVLSCEGGFWQKDLSKFSPAGSSKGCSFYMDEYKNKKTPVQLHWVLWNKGDRTHHIYDQESILTDQEVMNMANSVGQQLVIAQDLTNKK